VRSVAGDSTTLVDGQRLSVALLGDAIASNMLMVGVSWQLGEIPLSLAAVTPPYGAIFCSRLAHIAREEGDLVGEQFLAWFLREQREAGCGCPDSLPANLSNPCFSLERATSQLEDGCGL